MTVNQKLGVAAAIVAVLALIAGERPTDSIDLAALARAVEREEDHVSALELAEWLRAQKTNLRIVDVRSAADFELYHIPRAEHVALGQITGLTPRPGEVVVLYSEGGTHAAQAWFFLKAKGVRDVYFLRGGLNEWLDEVMSPALPVDAKTRALSEYFGGQPVQRSSEPEVPLEEQVRRLKRRTC